MLFLKITGSRRIIILLNCDPDTDVNDVGDGWDVSVYSASDINTEIVKEEGIITKGSVRFNAVKGRTYYIYVHSYHYSFPEGYTYQLATSFKGPKDYKHIEKTSENGNRCFFESKEKENKHSF